MNRINIFILFLLLIVSNVFSQSLSGIEKNSLRLSLHGQSSYLASLSDSSKNGFDIGRVSFELEDKFEKSGFRVISSYTNEQIQIEQLELNYYIDSGVIFKIGYFNPPLGRFSESSDLQLLMYNRSPLLDFCMMNEKLGIASEFISEDRRIQVSLGLYNNEVENDQNKRSTLDCSMSFHIMPLGYMDLSESAVNGYDDLKIDISPGLYFVQKDLSYYSAFDEVEEDKIFSLNTAFRYSTFSADLSYCKKNHDVLFEHYKSFWLDAYSAQIAYVLWNALEPSVRVTMYEDVLDEEYISDDHGNSVDDYANTIYECGLHYYLPESDSRIGLYYIKSENNIKTDFSETDLVEFEEVRLFMEINIDKLF